MKQIPEWLWNNPGEEPKKNEGSSEYLKAKQEAIDAAKKMEAELASMMEKHDRSDVFSDVSNFPQKNPEKGDTPEQQDFEKTFTTSVADHVQHTFLRKQFPNFIRICEDSRLGKNIPRDILALAFGIAESLAAVVKLSGHVIADIGELATSPRNALLRTKNIIS